MVQKFTQLTKDNIHKSLEKINTQGTEYLSRRGSLKLHNTTSTKIVRNLNEFMNFGKRIQRNITTSHSEREHGKLSKQISLDEASRRDNVGGGRRCSNVHASSNGFQEEASTCHEETETASSSENVRSIGNETSTNHCHSLPRTPHTSTTTCHTLPRTPSTLQREIRQVEDCLAKKIEAIPESLHHVDSSPDDDDSSEYFLMTSSITQELRLELENLNRNVLQDPVADVAEDIESGFESTSSSTQNCQAKYSMTGDEIFIWENPLEEANAIPQSHSANSLTSNKSSFESDSSTTSGADSIHSSDSTQQIREVAHVINSRQPRVGLPPPNEFGGGNPFLMFLCISVLCQHSEHIMTHQMDYNEMAIYFDKMIRKHNVHRVLNEARKRYESYLCNYRQMNRQAHNQSPRV